MDIIGTEAPPKPLLRAVSDPWSMTLEDPAGNEIDVTTHLVHANIEITAHGTYLTMVSAVDLVIDGIPIDRVAQAVSGLDGLTAQELDGVLANKGFSESSGQALIQHLHTRQGAARQSGA